MVVLGTGNDLVLHHVCQGDEICTVTGNTDNDIAVGLRIILGVDQCLTTDNAHLYLFAAIGEVSLDGHGKLGFVIICFQNVRIELHIQQSG